jgi:non-specific protein-tyrosine kinase
VARVPEQRPEEGAPAGVTLRDSLNVLWRRKWVVIVVTLLVTCAAFGASYLQAKVYEAQTDLIYEQELDVSNPLTGSSYSDPTSRLVELAAVDAVIKSPPMEQRVATLLEDQGVSAADYEVRSETVASASGNYQTDSVVSILATSNDPATATAVSQAYADAFVSWRKEHLRTQIQAAEQAVKAEMREYPDAAKESSDYVILQQRLRDLQILGATVTGNFRVLVPATVPEEPISPMPVRNAALGFVVGLLLGVGFAFLLEQLDTRVRRPDDVAAVLGQPVLARIPHLSRDQAKSHQLVTLAHPADPASEAFRLLRSNLSYMDVDHKAKTILVTSSLQGEGKSVLVANLAVTLALSGKKVVVVDADLRRPRQHRLFDLDNTVGASSLVAGESELGASLQPVSVLPAEDSDGGRGDNFAAWAAGGDAVTRLWVLTSGPIPPNPGELVASGRFAALLSRLRAEADVVLVDSPALLAVGDTTALAAEVDGLIFLVDMEKARRQVLQAAADQLYRLPCAMLGVAIRLQTGGRGEYYYSHYRYTEDRGAPGSGGNGSGTKARRQPALQPNDAGAVAKEG